MIAQPRQPRPARNYEIVFTAHGGPRQAPPQNYRYTPEPGWNYTLNVWTVEPGDKCDRVNLLRGDCTPLPLELGWLFCLIIEDGSTFICSQSLDQLRALGIEITEMADAEARPTGEVRE